MSYVDLSLAEVTDLLDEACFQLRTSRERRSERAETLASAEDDVDFIRDLVRYLQDQLATHMDHGNAPMPPRVRFLLLGNGSPNDPYDLTDYAE
ncbi:hypothetical protein V7S43_018978 [Phytophthora oleae]|uniref:Uncharacterized protein n=1 Tax=Phytophthora oleae TaxID=2107226 RepID=A0ABD3EPT2_9STRA